ncbi:oxidoreductase [Streptomyces xinghaiensis]|uniref:SDR family NAD(P)-dependent oxidoreductase n=2 Tax=Streptomyces TaxID=1883 RepID=A0A3R7IXM5_9ACTN|nr:MULTISPECIES: oxidoreductase [Streptomyces]KNE84102.1 short-chain dehydrogenase [Streptomyces fradiae]OFA59584.1 short-chain dehydrogenase [Streptomyces fradiae]PQM24789.1 KR domain-containing protein [Streptomyces xinghaiensis]RKM98843.1 SDR family NAD(P)-dependent oxidoreductase [Streptomyces xinghaiensis]RNC76256.1 SDR family NAD(P)-dependent oxidoreductase [Streptomyces xinghaiensis]
MRRWSVSDIPDQSGRTAVVTGANSGLGLVTARELARRGAEVVLACRDETRGRAAGARIAEEVPGARVRLARLDLADLASVREFAGAFLGGAGSGGPGSGGPGAGGTARLDLLINNAGVMALPYRRTADGFETQFGVNHLGHFALTGLLLPALLATPGARVVTVSSAMHLLPGAGDPGDPSGEEPYRRWMAYTRSKSANLLFTHELSRRLRRAGSDVVAAAAHPGYAATNLQTAGPRMEGRRGTERLMGLGGRLLAQPAAAGALPSLYAATAPDVRPDGFYGPGRTMPPRGGPAPARRAARTLDDAASERLWQRSEELTGVRYAVLDVPPAA